MPLDAASSQDIYSTTASSPDPYDSSSFPSTNLPNPLPPLPSHIDLSALPSPLPFFGPLAGYTQANLARLIQSRSFHLSHTLSRPLSEKEVTALAYHSAKGHAIASWGPGLGLAAAGYRWWSTREEFRWPFYGALKVEKSEVAEEVGNEAGKETGKETGKEAGKAKGIRWDGETLRIGEKEVLRQMSSTNKATLLHVLRGSTYGLLGIFVVPMVVSSYAATVTAVGEIRDSRLSAVTGELRKVADRVMKEQGEKRGEVRQDKAGQTRTGQGRQDMGSIFRERSERLQGKGRRTKYDDDYDDDMSPTGGEIGFGDDEVGMGDTGGVLNDSQMQQKEAQVQPPATRRTPTDNRASTFQIDKVARQPQSFGDDDPFDDASPTGGSGAATAGDQTAGLSAWERIRQQNSSSSGSASSSTSSSPSSSTSSPPSTSTSGSRRGRGMPNEQREGSTLGDSFSFSASEEERSYAKEEAQREFDERVEKERRGGEFGGEGGGRRW